MNDTWSKHLSKDDLAALLELVNTCLNCMDINGFTTLMRNLNKIGRFDGAVCTCVDPSVLPALLFKTMRPLNYQSTESLMAMHRFDRIYKIGAPFQDILPSMNLSDRFETLERMDDGRIYIRIKESGLNSIAHCKSYGTFEKSCNRWILLVFASSGSPPAPRAEAMVELAVPHLIQAFRGLRYLCIAQPYHLTKREYEIINWVKMGKTSWEIAKILGVSQACVNFHIDNLKKKFDAVNRTHAIAVAVGKGLIKM